MGIRTIKKNFTTKDLSKLTETMLSFWQLFCHVVDSANYNSYNNNNHFMALFIWTIIKIYSFI